MNYQVNLLLNKNTYQRFSEIEAQLQQQKNAAIAPSLALVLADLACEVIEQIFNPLMQAHKQAGQPSEQTMEQICQTLRKYLPWSINALNQQRLSILVEYLSQNLLAQNDHYYICYPVSSQRVQELKQAYNAVEQSKTAAIQQTFQVLQAVIDQGVNHLLRQPRKLLKFNMVVDKTLEGVTQITTQQGYKRLDKIANSLERQHALDYVNYFLSLIEHTEQT